MKFFSKLKLLNALFLFQLIIFPYYSFASERTKSASLFEECDFSELKSGTQRSSICDIWDEHINLLEHKLENSCRDAGETIFKKVHDVEGLYLYSDNPEKKLRERSNNIFHKFSAIKSHINLEYINPRRARFYREIEYFNQIKNMHEKISIESIEYLGDKKYAPKPFYLRVKTQTKYSEQPTIRYQLVSENLTDKQDQKLGFHGDLTKIVDRKSGETLAERKVYFYVIGNRNYLEDGTKLPVPSTKRQQRFHVNACQNYRPLTLFDKESFPKSAYEFVSRVLIPPAYDTDVARNFFGFSRGMGQLKEVCSSANIRVSPEFNYESMVFQLDNNDLVITAKNTEDKLTCELFRKINAHFKIEFHDGKRLNGKELLKLLENKDEGKK